MLKDALLLLSSELKGLRRDRGALIVIVFLPIFLMPVLFLGLFSSQRAAVQGDENRRYAIRVEGDESGEFAALLSGKLKLAARAEQGPDDYLVRFASPSADGRISVDIEYSSAAPGAAHVLDILNAALADYRMSVVRRELSERGLATGIAEPLHIATRDRTPEKALSSMAIAGMLPYLLIIYVFSGVLMIGVSATTGEKEKGSFSLLLLNRISRGSIALGKISYVMITGILNSVTSAVGLLLAGILGFGFGLFDINSVQKGASASAPALSPSALASILRPESFLLFLAQLLVVSSLFSSLIVVIGLRSRTIKEANGYTMPLFLLVLLAVLPTMTGSSEQVSVWDLLIPVRNTAESLKAILGGELSAKTQGLTLCWNMLLATGLALYVRRLFSDERILYTT
jgi:hypothetical protein